MARAALIPGFVAALLLGLIACSFSGPGPSVVVVFVLDTVRYDALGCYGHALDPTPNIDALAEDGVRFDQAISSSGWTLPAVGSLLTGTWPTLHGAMGKNVLLRPIRTEVATAAEVFKQHGYHTVGFANAAFVSPLLGVDRGFDVFDHKYSYNHDARRAGEVIDLAIQELGKRGEGSSFFFIHLFDPHLNYNPPSGYAAKYTLGRTSPPLPITMATCLAMQTGPERRGEPSEEDISYIRGIYQGEVSYMDEQIGRFIAELERLGLYENAAIVVTSDHGEEFWEHGGFEHGHSLYDELIHVPLILKLPAFVEAGERTVATPVRVLDIMPTLFDALGVAKPASFEGHSMLTLVRGEPDIGRPIFAESTLYGAAKLAWRDDRYKYIHDMAKGREGVGELYDWKADPQELRDLAALHPKLALSMRKKLFDFHLHLEGRAKEMSQPAAVDLAPSRILELRSLGYIR